MSKLKSTIQSNLETVQARIDRALDEALRNHAGLQVVAVSKRQPLAAVAAAYDLGIRDFGESQIQEAIPKVRAAADDIIWHFIGHLQKNKVRKAVKYFKYIHSVDSLSLLQRIDAISQEERVIPKIFLQVNFANDPNKYGLHPDAVPPVLETALSQQNCTCIGLMGIPPEYHDSEKTLDFFKGMATMRDTLKETFPDWPGQLSLGMSGDFELAIAAGANYIRPGSVIFGERH